MSKSSPCGLAHQGLLEELTRVHSQSCIAVRELEGAVLSLSSEDLRELVTVYASAERQRGRELATMIEVLGGQRPRAATIVLARTGFSNHSLIGGCRSELRSLRRAYERLLATELPELLVPELRAQLQAVRRAESNLRLLEEHSDL